jgi:hypothetical protein
MGTSQLGKYNIEIAGHSLQDGELKEGMNVGVTA